MRGKVKTDYDLCLKGVQERQHLEASKAWESLIEALVEKLKEDLVNAKGDRVIESQGAVKELRLILARVRKTSEE